MSYVTDIFAFQDWVEYESSITPSEISLWYALVRIFNKLGNPEELSIPISTLIPKCKLSRNSIYKSRNRLKQLGLIDFKDRKGNQSSVYKTIKFKKPTIDNNETICNLRTKISTQSDTQMSTQSDTQMDTQTQTQSQTQEEKISLNLGISEPPKNKIKNKIKNNNIKKEKEKKEKNAESVSPPSFNKQSEDILKLYNDNCTNLPKARQLSVKRNKQISLLFRRGYSLDDFQKVFENAQNSRFLCGENDRNWKANFDWLIIENNFLKALEGYYENFQTSSPPHKLEHKRSYNIEEYANYSIFDKVGESNYGNPNYHEYPEG